MSMPKFPEIDPDLTFEHSLNMILASIATEELALSHIINAEGEKLQYVLGTLENGASINPDIADVLKVNQSVASLLDSVTQNQMILKNKMDRALCALSEISPSPPAPPNPLFLPGPPGPPGPKGDPGSVGPPGAAFKSSATFKAAGKCRIWCPDSALYWDIAHLHGKCARIVPDNKTKIELCAKGRFVIYFTINVKTASDRKCNAAISLQTISNHKCTDIYTVHSQVSAETTVTMSMNGVIIDAFDDCAPDSLMLRLVSPDPLTVGNSMLSIIEI